jgi:hypothetical protein
MRTAPMLLLALLVAAFAGAVSPALAGADDVTSTQAYVQANYTLVQGARTRIASSEAALKGVLGQVRRECPKAALGSPQNHDSEQLSDEVVGAIVLAGLRPNVPAVHVFTHSVARLKWSSRKLTSTLQSYARKLNTLSALAPPDLCADVRQWVAGGYQTLPASTVSFDARYTPAWVALGELPRSLAPFERPAEHGLLRRSNQSETLLTEAEARAVETYAEILDALELKQ